MSDTLGRGTTLDYRIMPSRSDQDLELLRESILETPRRIPSKFFYDARGSRLFEEITRLPEYYLTRSEGNLLQRHADEIAIRTEAAQIVELGSGSSIKTRFLLDATTRAGLLQSYVPLDVSETELRRVVKELAQEYPELTVSAVVADFNHDLAAIPDGSPRLTLLLGSTIGNFDRAEATSLLKRIAGSLKSGDWFLLGIDLVKDSEQVEAAYNDSAQVTAEFNRNILRVVNRLAGGNFEPQSFEHSAPFDPVNDWVQMRLVSTKAQEVTLSKLNLDLTICAGEVIVTEISSKYRREGVIQMLTAAGLKLAQWYTDSDKMFALALAKKG